MSEEIEILLGRYFEGNLTEKEQSLLESWLDERAENRQLLADYQLLWTGAVPSVKMLHINTEKALIATKQRISFFSKNNILVNLQRIAAVLITAVLLSSAYIWFFQSSPQQELAENTVYQEVTTAFGTRSKFLLPDGSTVWLNSGSKLIFPTLFKGDRRQVVLSGEAYFEVQHNEAMPFIVKTPALAIRVLGTSFNVQAYEGSKQMVTTLVEGKVVLERYSNDNNTVLAELKPNERAVLNYTNHTLKIHKEEDIDKFIAWKDGKLVFFDDPIEEVASKLGNWYNVEVQIRNQKLKNYHFTATFTDEPIEQVLDLLSKSSPIQYKIVKATKHEDNSYSKRIVILN